MWCLNLKEAKSSACREWEHMEDLQGCAQWAGWPLLHLPSLRLSTTTSTTTKAIDIRELKGGKSGGGCWLNRGLVVGKLVGNKSLSWGVGGRLAGRYSSLFQYFIESRCIKSRYFKINFKTYSWCRCLPRRCILTRGTRGSSGTRTGTKGSFLVWMMLSQSLLMRILDETKMELVLPLPLPGILPAWSNRWRSPRQMKRRQLGRSSWPRANPRYLRCFFNLFILNSFLRPAGSWS